MSFQQTIYLDKLSCYVFPQLAVQKRKGRFRTTSRVCGEHLMKINNWKSHVPCEHLAAPFPSLKHVSLPLWKSPYMFPVKAICLLDHKYLSIWNRRCITVCLTHSVVITMSSSQRQEICAIYLQGSIIRPQSLIIMAYMFCWMAAFLSKYRFHW